MDGFFSTVLEQSTYSGKIKGIFLRKSMWSHFLKTTSVKLFFFSCFYGSISSDEKKTAISQVTFEQSYLLVCSVHQPFFDIAVEPFGFVTFEVFKHLWFL